MAESLLANSRGLKKASDIYARMKKIVPANRGHLRNYIKVYLGTTVPDKPICAEHQSPMDYLWHVFSSDLPGFKRYNGDCVVWANRGGGKTQIAAAATLLDCLFKPNCQVRILGGSGEQASRMYEYLLGFLNKGFDNLLCEPVRKGGCNF